MMKVGVKLWLKASKLFRSSAALAASDPVTAFRGVIDGDRVIDHRCPQFVLMIPYESI